MKKITHPTLVGGKQRFRHTVLASIVQGRYNFASLCPGRLAGFQKILIGALLLFSFACGLSSKEEAQSNSNTITAQSGDLFPDKAEVKYAKGFTIDYFDTYKVVNVLNHFEEHTDTLKYVLVQRGTPAPTKYPNSQIIETPLESMVAMSSMHIALADYLGEADIITGLGSLQYVTSPTVRENIDSGRVVEVGVGAAANNELLISLQPDLILAMASPDAKVGGYSTVTEAGIPVMIVTEWLESTPLGKAEWVKVMAALLNKEKLANEKFDSIAASYNQYVKLAEEATEKPVVIAGMPYKGTWFVPDGDSYMGKFLKDAQTTYHWSDTKGKGSLHLDFETVYPVALTADYWVKLGYENSLQDVAGKDSRYTDFKPFKEGKVYNNNKRVNDLGANDYWESGALYPHLVLADLIHIFHPDLLPEHELVYYKQLK